MRAQTRKEAKGAIMEGWNMGIVKSLQVSAPSMEVQRKFESIAKIVSNLSTFSADAAGKVDALIAALSSQYFDDANGVQVPVGVNA